MIRRTIRHILGRYHDAMSRRAADRGDMQECLRHWELADKYRKKTAEVRG